MHLSPVTTIPTKLRWSAMENGDADLKFPGSCRCSFRLLLCLKTPCVLVMEIHTACQSADPAAGDAGSYYTYAGFLVMGNGNAYDHPASWIPLRNQQLLVTRVAGLQPRVMENGEGSSPPAARDAGRAPCLLPSDAGEGWQWSQWREQRYPKRCTVSFEGRSLP